jgi:hypothetical protein
MHIKPYVILGLASLSAGTGLGIVVAATDPYTAEPIMMRLFWVSLVLTVWGSIATVCSLARLRLAPALMVGLVWVLGVVGLAGVARHGSASKRLSAGVILATIVLSLAIWIKSKKSAKQPSMN